MHYTKILWSLGTITVIGAVTVGITGAFFTDTAESQGNTFNSGTLDLEINPVEASGGWGGTISAGDTPGYGALNPGGDEANLSTRLRNVGTADSEAIGLEVDHTTNENVIAAQMRITQLDWKGESLLEGGAGANLSDYTPPTSCDVTVADTEDIQTDGIDQAASGETVCVEAGTYNEFVVNKDVTVAGLNNPDGGSAAVVSPSGSSVNTIIEIESSDATVTGLKLDGSGVNHTGSQYAGIGILDSNSLSNITIDSNILVDLNSDSASNKAIQVFADENGATNHSNVSITNNRIDGVTSPSGAYGVQIVNDVSGILIENNTIANFSGGWGAGVAVDGNNPVSESGVTILRNQIMDHQVDSGHFSVQVEVNALSDEVLVNENNLETLLHGGSTGDPANEPLNAENNWWGDFDASDDVVSAPASNVVNYTPIAGGPYIGFVNGTDNNGNGFADLQDLAQNPITNATPGLDAGETGDLDFFVQLDGPSTGNSYQDSDLISDFTFTLGQIVN